MSGIPSGIGDDYKLALGSLVMEVSILDSKVTELIASMTEMEITYALILVHHQQAANKIDGLRALFRLIYPDEADPQYQPVKQIVDRVKTVTDFRNSVVHALWRVDEAGVPNTIRFQARGELTRSQHPAPIEKIRQSALEAAELSRILEGLSRAYRGWAKVGTQ